MSNNPLTGQSLGDYIVGPLIGGGGMGEVYQAFPVQDLRNPVAIKVLREKYAKDPEFQARFMREIRVMEALDHPHIVPILGYGVADQVLYLVMKLIKGTTLFSLLQKQAFSPVAVLKVVLPLTKALHYGHTQGAIHRDLKPSNVFVEQTREGSHIYLGDFGLAKRPQLDELLTAQGTSVGTPEYMAPEAALGLELDARSDVYSLAVMTYELLLGVLPFRKKNKEMIAVAHLREAPPTPASLQPDFPPSLQAAVLHGLAKDREDRPQTMKDFATELYKAVEGIPDDLRQRDYWIREL